MSRRPNEAARAPHSGQAAKPLVVAPGRVPPRAARITDANGTQQARHDGSELALPIPDALIEAAARCVAARAVELLREELGRASPWMTTEEAAEYLRIPLGTFQERAARGEFDAIVKREGRRAYYHRLDLDAHRRYAAGGSSTAVGAGGTPTRRRHG